jgi:hypothetical protein
MGIMKLETIVQQDFEGYSSCPSYLTKTGELSYSIKQGIYKVVYLPIICDYEGEEYYVTVFWI